MKNHDLKTPKRKRVVPLWRRPKTIFCGTLFGLLALGLTGTWAVESGRGEAALNTIKWQAIKVSSDIGLTLQDVFVTGRHETNKSDLLASLGIVRGAPMLAYDFEKAKARVETLPWVQHARIERRLPDTLVVRLIERIPIALWQNQGKFSLIDEDGEVIVNEGLARFSNLIQVVGADAPERVGGLLELLGTQPTLKKKVVAAVRVGGRRWDLLLKSGINVRLPEQGAPAALARLGVFESKTGILGRDVKALDLRMPDRVIVRKSPVAARKPFLKPGQET